MEKCFHLFCGKTKTYTLMIKQANKKNVLFKNCSLEKYLNKDQIVYKNLFVKLLKGKNLFYFHKKKIKSSRIDLSIVF